MTASLAVQSPCRGGAAETNAASADPEIHSSPVPKISYWSLPHKPQLFILMLARLAEPLAASSIQSYLYFQLQHFDPSASPATISGQAGLIVGAKTAAHVCTGLLWGRLADSEFGGRKIVLIIGLLSTAVAMLGYGFSESFAAAITWQIIDGALNSTVPMVRCITAELNPLKRERARALTLLPLCANAGHMLGPLIGGFLVFNGQKHEPNSFLARYPYAPANIFIAAIHAIIALSCVFALQETLQCDGPPNPTRMPRFWTQWRLKNASAVLNRPANPAAQDLDESAPLLVNSHAHTTESSASAESRPELRRVNTGIPFRQLWTFNVISTMATYFIISGHVGTFPSLWAIFLSTPRDLTKSQHPPFKFYGGLGMDPRGVGTAMSLQGVIAVITQVILYPTLNDRFGTLRLWRAGLFVFPFAYLLAPYCALVSSYAPPDSALKFYDASAQALIWSAVLFVLLLFVCGRVGVAPATTMLINDCTPHPSARGTIHTIGTIVTSLSRSIFPPIAFSIFGYGLRIGVVGLGFWFIAALAILACVASMWVTEGGGDVVPPGSITQPPEGRNE